MPADHLGNDHCRVRGDSIRQPAAGRRLAVDRNSIQTEIRCAAATRSSSISMFVRDMTSRYIRMCIRTRDAGPVQAQPSSWATTPIGAVVRPVRRANG